VISKVTSSFTQSVELQGNRTMLDNSVLANIGYVQTQTDSTTPAKDKEEENSAIYQRFYDVWLKFFFIITISYTLIIITMFLRLVYLKVNRHRNSITLVSFRQISNRI
jgi:hypothetical protein